MHLTKANSISTMNKTIRIASISDVHLHHARNPTERIIKNMHKYLVNDRVMSKIDMLVIVGDLFDKMVELPNEDVPSIKMFVARLILLCAKYKVKLRVLEGTPDHDCKQPSMFDTFAEVMKLNGLEGLDMAYVQTLSIEYIPDFDINVLYVPDEWASTTADTLDQVRSLMREKDLEQVDFAFMHGMFRFQLDFVAKEHQIHDQDIYLSLVKYLIFIGHIHSYSNYQRIYSQGSFDRLAQGEEDDKGYLMAEVSPSGDYQMKRVINHDAMIFKTIVIEGLDVAEAIASIDEIVKDYPQGSYVRVRVSATNPLLANKAVIKERWPLLVWSFEKNDQKENIRRVPMDQTKMYEPLILNRQNLADVVADRMLKQGVCDQDLQESIALLRETMEMV